MRTTRPCKACGWTRRLAAYLALGAAFVGCAEARPASVTPAAGMPAPLPSAPPAAEPGAAPAVRQIAGYGDLAAWQNVTYFPWSPKVAYTRARDPVHGEVLKAVSADAGSMFLRFVSFDPRRTPMVSWRWRVAGPIPGADERTKDGDDAAARVYFVWGLKDKGDLFGARAIGYIWGRTRRPGERGLSPYTERIGIVALRAGKAGAGAWQDERRDLAADYRALFGQAPPGPVTAVALLTDTDQTDGRATSWYGPIHVGPAP